MILKKKWDLNNDKMQKQEYYTMPNNSDNQIKLNRVSTERLSGKCAIYDGLFGYTYNIKVSKRR